MLFLLPLTGLALGAFARTAYVFPDDKGKKENVSIRIEGANFYSSDGKSGKPLFVVDGLEVASIDTLSPDRIASVTVLKDASAEALYGEKGRNGVVVVSTKDAAGVRGIIRSTPRTALSRSWCAVPGRCRMSG